MIQPFIYIREVRELPGRRAGQRADRQGRRRSRPRHRLHAPGLNEAERRPGRVAPVSDPHPASFLTDILGQALNGLAYGALLFLLSVGLTLIFGMLDIVNLAHGSFYMLGAYAGLATLAATGNFWLAAIAAPLAVGLSAPSSSAGCCGRSTADPRSTRCC